MNAKLVVMLTHNDQTVKNAQEVFEENKDLDVKCWGFKDVGLPVDQMEEVVAAMKAAGKETYLECVSYDEPACRRAAAIAIKCGFDYFCGTIFYDSVYALLETAGTRYMPFCGAVSENPSILQGSADEIIQDAKRLAGKGVYGLDLLAYRAVDTDPETLAERAIREVGVPILVAGSINSFDRILLEEKWHSWGFTIGGALFTAAFAPGEGFRKNLMAVADFTRKH
jgi:hypothetical protein